MSTNIRVRWQSQRTFVGSNDDGDSLTLDGGHNGKGMSPSEAILAALGGCVSTTIIGVLEKKRQQVTGLEVVAAGEHMPDWPKAYTDIHLTYKVTGRDLTRRLWNAPSSWRRRNTARSRRR